MASLLNKFQEVVKTLATSPTVGGSLKEFQFEMDMKRLFVLTSCNRLGRNAQEADVEDLFEMAGKASVTERLKHIQENIHFQITNFCTAMNEILLPDATERTKKDEAPAQSNAAPTNGHVSAAISEMRQLKRAEVSRRLKDHIGYTLDVKQSLIPQKEPGLGLFVNGEADAGTVIAIFPGVIHSPAYHRYIPGFPRINDQKYFITRYDGTVINAYPWGSGGESREAWDGLGVPEIRPNVQSTGKGPELVWRILSKPLEGTEFGSIGDVLERRNPLALGHFANYPAKGMYRNAMICPYDFPLTETDMRTYIPNVSFANPEEVNMSGFDNFWFRSSAKNSESNVPILKTVVLVAARALCDEEVLRSYRRAT